MNPLIDNFTNILKPCSGCGKAELSSSSYDQFFEKRTKGEKVKFIVQIEVETDKASNIDLKSIEDASKGDVLSVNPRLQPQIQQSTVVRPTPAITGSRQQ